MVGSATEREAEPLVDQSDGLCAYYLVGAAEECDRGDAVAWLNQECRA